MPRAPKKVSAPTTQVPTAPPQYAPTQYAAPQHIAVPTTAPAQSQKKKRGFPWVRIVVALLLALVVLFALYKGGEFIYKSLFMPTVSSEQIDEKAVLEELQRIAVLPDDKPQIATVSDPETVRKQSSFFENVAKGDLIVAFLKTKQIIIYRPSSGKIVNMSTIAGQ